MLKTMRGFLGDATKLAPSLKKAPKAPTAPKAPKAPTPTATSVQPAAQPSTPQPAPDPKPQAVPAPAPSPAAGGQILLPMYPEDKSKSLASKYRDACWNTDVVEYYSRTTSVENADLIINAAYRQVFGNAYLMESERLPIAESQLRSGEITVSEFVRQLANSEHYRKLFWEKYPPVKAVELNFKHLLGRAPESQAEIAQHLQTLATGGWEAEIDSYIYSDEYFQAFGDYQVPYPRGYQTLEAKACVGFTHAFPLFGAACASDKSSDSSREFNPSLMDDSPSPMPQIRPIPEAFPAELAQGPEPRIPTEIRAIAHELWKQIEQRPKIYPYY